MRLRALALALATVGAGLLSRHPSAPGWVHATVGDALYAVLLVALAALFRPATSPVALAAVGLAGAVTVELSQLVHAGPLDALRATRLGALVLGRGFRWADLGCYAIGAVVGGLVWGWTRGGPTAPPPSPAAGDSGRLRP